MNTILIHSSLITQLRDLYMVHQKPGSDPPQLQPPSGCSRFRSVTHLHTAAIHDVTTRSEPRHLARKGGDSLNARLLLHSVSTACTDTNCSCARKHSHRCHHHYRPHPSSAVGGTTPRPRTDHSQE